MAKPTDAGGVARRAACAALVDVLLDGQRLDTALTRHQTGLPCPRDRTLCRALTTGAVRWRERLAAITAHLLHKPLKDKAVQVPIIIGLYQMLYMRVPDHAAISTSVELTAQIGVKSARGLVNGLLRRFQRERVAVLAAVDAEPTAVWSHPRWLIESLHQSYPERWQDILTANNTQAPLTLRANRRRTNRASLADALARLAIDATPSDYAEHGLHLSFPPHYSPSSHPPPSSHHPGALPGFEAGHFSVQDAASQLVVQTIEPRSTGRVLDACAAPGGKTTALLEAFDNLHITAVELAPERSQQLQDNLRRLRLRAEVIEADVCDLGAWWDRRPFDHILLDVPCSATGIIRRHPDIKLRRKREDVERFAAQQLTLLQSCWPLLAKGGTLVYATCSVLPAENSEVIRQFLASRVDAGELPLEVPWGTAALHGRQIFPGEAEMDGFYYARLTKS
ncbi:MAG: 16S rRNA (cytosine(967)-C(5))-methyltransferase RsmB [Gammaproteobacteria bacterium]|nr:16S rRNA (cytosine(967)-C(5))-methyltransferase RsmB [Gammaproteobacteria bacterium]